jgi:hypothetical protein
MAEDIPQPAARGSRPPEDNTSPLHWPTAIITETHPAKDNNVRVVTVRTPKGTFKRPIAKIHPFPRMISE